MALNLVERVGLTGQEAALLMGLPLRQTRRLLAAMDDDAGMIYATLFRKQEHPYGDLLLLRETIAAKDAPLAVYSYRHSGFQVNPQARGDSGEAVGRGAPTHPAWWSPERAGAPCIVALPPQAKGRVERLLGTLLDRLSCCLRLAELKTMAVGQPCHPNVPTQVQTRLWPTPGPSRRRLIDRRRLIERWRSTGTP